MFVNELHAKLDEMGLDMGGSKSMLISCLREASQVEQDKKEDHFEEEEEGEEEEEQD